MAIFDEDGTEHDEVAVAPPASLQRAMLQTMPDHAPQPEPAQSNGLSLDDVQLSPRTFRPRASAGHGRVEQAADGAGSGDSVEVKFGAPGDPHDDAIYVEEGTTALGIRETPCEFLTGQAGSGKSYTLRQRLEADPFYAVLAATTGIAAVNLNATTIHSLLGFFDEDSLNDAYLSGAAQRKLRRVVGEGYKNVVVDEVSMLSHSMLDLLVKVFDDTNQTLAHNEEPIGLILCGDACQLPAIPDQRGKIPGKRVKLPTPWFFDASSWSRFARNTTKLTKVWRQTDERYLAILSYARAGNGRAVADLLAAAGVQFHNAINIQFDGTTLVGKNEEVDRFNQLALDKVQGRLMALPARRWGKLRSEWKNIPDKTIVRENAYVMILANKYSGPGEFLYVNGDCGHVRGIRPSPIPGQPPAILVELVRNGQVVPVDSIVRGVESKERPDDMHNEVTIGRADDFGGYLAQPHYRAAAKRYVAGQIEYFPIRLGYASTIHKCVSANERVPIFGKGMLQLADVAPGDITPFGALKAVADSSRNAVTIRTHRGYEIVCSVDHRWQTKRGMVETKTLKVGESVQLALGRPFPGSEQVSTELAWFLGALIGDGSYNDRDDGTLHMACGKDPEVGHRYKAYINDIEGLRCEWRKGKVKNGLHSSSKPFRRKLLALGLDYVTSVNKKIPEAVWQSGWSAWGAFLQGLFDTDGHVGKSFVVLSTASEQMGKDVQNMLLALGILSKRRKCRVGYRGTDHWFWQVFVAAAGIPDFIERVNFSVTRKREKLEAMRPNRNFTRTDGFDEIVAIEPSRKRIPMRDVEVPAPHSMSFGPFVGHNCQGLSLDAVQIDFRGWSLKGPGMGYVALSRCRSLEGLRIVGLKEDVAGKCNIDARVKDWL